MLKNLESNINNDSFKNEISLSELQVEFAKLQRELKANNKQVLIVFEGWEASGKGTLINELIQELDPRGYRVEVFHESSIEEKRKPFLWRFWQAIPKKGEIVIFDRSWYREILDVLPTKSNKDKLEIKEILNFEQILMDEGIIIIKYFLHINKNEQKSRISNLLSNKATRWRIDENDVNQNKNYNKFFNNFDSVLELTNTAQAPWVIIDSKDKKNASSVLINSAIEICKNSLSKMLSNNLDNYIPYDNGDIENRPLSKINLCINISKEEYKKKIDKLQQKIQILAYDLYRAKIPTILVFEGWDAAGKGGSIKRLTRKIDPRGYKVIPIAAPDETEKSYHYMWRFWKHFPKSGHMTIFDRSWYGRVMVEKVEKFAKDNEWMRAYKEINLMEKHLKSYDAIILKFFIHIDKDEQLSRFKDREINPDKKYKITDEDWRNREKWDLYEDAINEMISKTSNKYAPWIIVPGNSKLYARIYILEKVIEVMEDALNKIK